MIASSLHVRLLAIGLSALAGFVDALAFIHLGGFFVSFMSGNSTRIGVGLADGWPDAAQAASLILIFVLGVMAGSWVGRRAGGSRAVAVLALVSGCLCLAAFSAALSATVLAVGFMALAMGAENAVFEKDGEVSIGLTYMTGALVKLGQHLTSAFMGGSPLAFLPYLGLWAGLVAGATAGAMIFPVLGLDALWLAAALALTLTLVTNIWLPVSASEPSSN